MSVSAAATHTFQMSDHLSTDIPTDYAKQQAAPKKELTMYAEEEPSFWDVLDVINPLQHIPIVNTLYREITGDRIGIGARLAGGTLFGGPIGLVASMVNCAIEQETGKDTSGHMLALFRDDEAAPPAGEPSSPPTAIAMAEPAMQPPPSVERAAFVPQVQPAAPAAPSAPPMIFSADGDIVPTAAPAKSVPIPAAADRPMPLVGQPPPRFMPLPARNPAIGTRNSPPPISVPVSNSGSRSNVPITGRDPVANLGPSPATVQRILENQGHKGAELPAAASGTAADGQQDWFSSAMMTGLDKYEQAAKLNRQGERATPIQ